MRAIALLLLCAAPSVLSLPFTSVLPYGPEPGSLLMLLAGLVGVAVIRRRQG